VPLLIAPLFAFACGALLGLAHVGPPGARGLARGRTIVAMFAALTLWPVLAWEAQRSASWTTLYMIDPRLLSGSLLLAASVLVAALAPVGYEAAVRLGRSPARDRLALVAIPTAFGVVLSALFHDRLGVVTTFSDRARGAPGTPLFDTGFGAGLVAVALLLAVGLAVAFRVMSEPRRAAPGGQPGRESG